MHRLATDKISISKRTLKGGKDHQLGRKRHALELLFFSYGFADLPSNKWLSTNKRYYSFLS